MINTQEDFFNNNFTSYFICKGTKGLLKGLRVRGSWRPNRNCNILTSTLMAVNVVSFSFSRAAQPEALGPLYWVMASFTASYQHLLWTPTHQGPKPLRPGVAFPTTFRLSPSPTVCNSTGTRTPTQLNYIIVRRPLDL